MQPYSLLEYWFVLGMLQRYWSKLMFDLSVAVPAGRLGGATKSQPDPHSCSIQWRGGGTQAVRQQTGHTAEGVCKAFCTAPANVKWTVDRHFSAALHESGLRCQQVSSCGWDWLSTLHSVKGDVQHVVDVLHMMRPLLSGG
jgi:hypothetical protein